VLLINPKEFVCRSGDGLHRACGRGFASGRLPHLRVLHTAYATGPCDLATAVNLQRPVPPSLIRGTVRLHSRHQPTTV